MEYFYGENLLEFSDRFSDNNSCKLYMSEVKWISDFSCTKCGHEKYSSRKNHSRTCTKCKYTESSTAGTMFHKVKFGLRKAFMIVFEMTNSTRGLSASQVAKRYGITRKTAWLFMHKVRIAMKSSEEYPMEGNVQVDEFSFGGKEKGKQGRSYDTKKKKVISSVEMTDEGKVKRLYSMKIDDYSSKSLRKIFEKHISKTAHIDTDKWKGYKPIMNDYNITQKYSDNGQGLKQMHTMIHQLKSWIRTIYSWIDHGHTDKYLDEFSFRVNRSIYKNTIFHKLIERVIKGKHYAYNDIIIANK